MHMRSSTRARSHRRAHSSAALWVALLAGLAAGASARDLSVGPTDGDIVGSDNAALQRAVDMVSHDGGGTVFVKSGTYTMVNSLMLRSGVSLVGIGPAPVLQKADGITAKLAGDADYAGTELVVEDASSLQPGMGVTLSDDVHNTGWYPETRTLTALKGTTLTLDEPLELDFLAARHAKLETAYPLLCGRQVTKLRIENLVADGNRGSNAPLTGCCGGAIYLWKSAACRIIGCTARNFNGDGISLQVSPLTEVLRCRSYRNSGHGIECSAGSVRVQVTDCHAYDNDGAGLYLGSRVSGSRFTGNDLQRNGLDGVSLGHQDTDNLLAGNSIERNGRHGVHFRPETALNGAHRNTLQDNLIRSNGQVEPGDGIHVDAVTLDLEIRGNTIENAPRDGRPTQRNGIYLARGVDGVKTRANVFGGLTGEALVDESGGVRNSLQM